MGCSLGASWTTTTSTTPDHSSTVPFRSSMLMSPAAPSPFALPPLPRTRNNLACRHAAGRTSWVALDEAIRDAKRQAGQVVAPHELELAARPDLQNDRRD